MSLLDELVQVLGIDDCVEPRAELIAARNVYAHYRPSQIVPDRLWADTVEAIGPVRQPVGSSGA